MKLKESKTVTLLLITLIHSWCLAAEKAENSQSSINANDSKQMTFRQLTEPALANPNIKETSSQPFAIVADGTILLDQTYHGSAQSFYRNISPIVCIDSKNYAVFSTTQTRWNSKYFIPELMQDTEFAENFDLAYLGKCHDKSLVEYSPNKHRVENLIKESLNRAISATARERARCDSPHAVDTSSDINTSTQVSGAGNQAVLNLCNVIPVCSNQARYAVNEQWVFADDREPKLISSNVQVPYVEIYFGDDAGCPEIGSAIDLDGDGNMELKIYDYGAESWELTVKEYEDGNFVTRAYVDDGV